MTTTAPDSEPLVTIAYTGGRYPETTGEVRRSEAERHIERLVAYGMTIIRFDA